MTDWISDTEAACEAATEGPWLSQPEPLEGQGDTGGWLVDGNKLDGICYCPHYSSAYNAHFIALARTALPRALKALREKQAKDEKTEVALRAADELVEIATQCIDRFSYYEKDMQDRLLIENLISKRKAYREARK